MNKILLILVAITFLITGCDELDTVLNENATATEGIAADKEVVTIDRVVDGDTILIKYNGEDTKLRIIGINTPETVDSRKPIECFGPEASSYLSALLTGKSVSIETDYTQDDTDKYGRLLRYVYLDNEDVGYKIISGGYGYEYTYNIPYQKQSQYKNAQAEAMENGVGLWTSCANT